MLRMSPSSVSMLPTFSAAPVSACDRTMRRPPVLWAT